MATFGWLGTAGQGGARLGVAWRGNVWLARRGAAGQGVAGRGLARFGWQGKNFLEVVIMEKQYSWKAGAQFPVKASVAADTIRSLQETLGKNTVTAKELLDASRDENAPLHSCFEWDDDIAAEQYRLWQARHLIGSIEVVITKGDTPIQTREFVNVEVVAPKVKGEYAPVELALNNGSYRTQVLKNALNELRAFQRKYAVYQELSGVSKAIDAFADAIQ